MRVLVTGANGFVGRHVVRRLAADGHEVVAGCGPTPAPDAPADAPGAVRWTPLDVTSPRSVEGFLGDGGDAVIHLAGIASAREANADAALAWRVNALGTAHVALRLADAKRTGRADPLLLISSSAEVYMPRVNHRHTEADPVGPGTPYAASKLGAELAGLAATRAGLRVVVVRPFPHIGAGQSDRFWVMRRVRVLLEAKRRGAPAITVGDLSPVRDFLHVDDVVDAYARLLSTGTPGEVYNIASGEGVTLAALHDTLEDLIGVHPLREQDAAEIRPDARPYHVGDASKLAARTGWAPRRSLEDALREVIDAQAD